MSILLSCENLSVSYGENKVLNNFGFEINNGEKILLFGNSGCGKTTFLKSILNIENGKKYGKIFFENEEISKKHFKNDIAYIPQNCKASLNPLLKIGEQIYEVLQNKMKKSKAKIEAFNLLKQFKLEEYFNKYPFELSGGMCQKVMILIAAAKNPKLILADEPTSSLDEKSKKEALAYMCKLTENFGSAIIISSHDKEVFECVDRVIYFKQGENKTDLSEILAKKVFDKPIIKIENLNKSYGKKKIFENFDFILYEGEILGISGESGCGKSTLAKIITNLDEYECKKFEKNVDKICMIMQDPYMAIDPKFRIYKTICEGLNLKKDEMISLSKTMLSKIMFPENLYNKYPKVLSGGQRQLLALTSALCYKPNLIILDEAFSMTDENVKNMMWNQLKEYKNDRVSYIVISHNREMLEKYCNRIIFI